MVRQVGRAVDTLLLVVMALLLVAKIALAAGFLGQWRSHVDVSLFAVLGLYGLLVGLRNRRAIAGVLSALAGVFLVTMPFAPPFEGRIYVTAVAVGVVLLTAIFIPGRKRK